MAVDSETRDPHLVTKDRGFVRGDAEVVGISLAWPGGRDVQSYYQPIAMRDQQRGRGHAAASVPRHRSS